MKKYFGTDGIRGLVGKLPITANFILQLGWALGSALKNAEKKKVIIGKDTRISGYMIESALEAGLSSAGVDVYMLGPMPTPAIAYLTKTFSADLGIVISASHNDYDDNGIKIFADGGEKISTEFEKLIESYIEQPFVSLDSKQLGKAFRISDAQGRYIEFCKSTIPHKTSFKGLKIVIDCANGATYKVAPSVFSELGAEVIAINTSPNGMNINLNCGSNHPGPLSKIVLAEKADLGIAFDGDGDRVVMIDAHGEVLNGDQILYIVTKSLLSAKRLSGGVVGTQMSNKGLEIALNNLGVAFDRVPVGDANVIQRLNERNWQLGGESSGHIIYTYVTTTADAIVAALQVLLAMNTFQQSLYEIKQGLELFSQKTINIPYQDKKIELTQPKIKDAMDEVQKKLGAEGNILLRYSGTQPCIRLMIEGKDPKTVDHCTKELGDLISEMVAEK